MKKVICVFILLILIIIFYLLFRRIYINNINFESYNCPLILGKKKEDQYIERNLFSNSKIVICGLIRNGQDTIPQIKQKVQQISSYFKDYTVLIVENDSTDNSRPMLLEWARINPKIKILGCGVTVDECKLKMPETIIHDGSPDRIKKMVELRNVYMDYLQNPEFDDYNFCLVMDMDLVAKIYNDGLLSTEEIFYLNPTLDAVVANGIGYYRILGPIYYFTYHDPYAHLDLNGNISDNKKLHDIHSTLSRFYYYYSPVEYVRSAFSGFSMYNFKSFRNKRYSLSVNEGGVSECEHVTFNKQLDNIVLNPKMLFIIFKNN